MSKRSKQQSILVIDCCEDWSVRIRLELGFAKHTFRQKITNEKWTALRFIFNSIEEDKHPDVILLPLSLDDSLNNEGIWIANQLCSSSLALSTILINSEIRSEEDRKRLIQSYANRLVHVPYRSIESVDRCLRKTCRCFSG